MKLYKLKNEQDVQNVIQSKNSLKNIIDDRSMNERMLQDVINKSMDDERDMLDLQEKILFNENLDKINELREEEGLEPLDPLPLEVTTQEEQLARDQLKIKRKTKKLHIPQEIKYFKNIYNQIKQMERGIITQSEEDMINQLHQEALERLQETKQTSTPAQKSNFNNTISKEDPQFIEFMSDISESIPNIEYTDTEDLVRQAQEFTGDVSPQESQDDLTSLTPSFKTISTRNKPIDYNTPFDGDEKIDFGFDDKDNQAFSKIFDDIDENEKKIENFKQKIDDTIQSNKSDSVKNDMISTFSQQINLLQKKIEDARNLYDTIQNYDEGDEERIKLLDQILNDGDDDDDDDNDDDDLPDDIMSRLLSKIRESPSVSFKNDFNMDEKDNILTSLLEGDIDILKVVDKITDLPGPDTIASIKLAQQKITSQELTRSTKKKYVDDYQELINNTPKTPENNKKISDLKEKIERAKKEEETATETLKLFNENKQQHLDVLKAKYEQYNISPRKKVNIRQGSPENQRTSKTDKIIKQSQKISQPVFEQSLPSVDDDDEITKKYRKLKGESVMNEIVRLTEHNSDLNGFLKEDEKKLKEYQNKKHLTFQNKIVNDKKIKDTEYSINETKKMMETNDKYLRILGEIDNKQNDILRDHMKYIGSLEEDVERSRIETEKFLDPIKKRQVERQKYLDEYNKNKEKNKEKEMERQILNQRNALNDEINSLNKNKEKKSGKGLGKISKDGTFGKVHVDVNELNYNLKLVVHKNGRKVMSRKVTEDVVDLLTKKYNSKKKYDKTALDIFEKVVEHAELRPKILKYKQKLIGGNIAVMSPDDMIIELKKLTNRKGLSQLKKNKGSAILDKLLELNVIDNSYHKSIYYNHFS
jgi:hypothetical protein